MLISQGVPGIKVYLPWSNRINGTLGILAQDMGHGAKQFSPRPNSPSLASLAREWVMTVHCGVKISRTQLDLKRR